MPEENTARDHTSTPGPGEGLRLRQLDALRGIAALSVVLLHFHDLWLPMNYRGLSIYKKALLAALAPLYAGSEAVTMFFVLSGLVLALPYLAGRQQPYPAYLLRRILRLYGPYVVALAIALGAASIWHNHPFYGAWIASTWSQPLDAGLILQHVALVGVFATRQYLFVVWTLVQEMRISAAFPALVKAIAPLSSSAKLATGFAMSIAAVLGIQRQPEATTRFSLLITIHFAAIFIVGIVLASELDRIKVWWRNSSPATHRALCVLSACLYFCDKRIAGALLKVLPDWANTMASRLAMANWAASIGAAGFIIIALHASSAGRLLRTAPAQFLGWISYSLYLLHPIVLLSLRFAAGNSLSKWVQLPLYVAGSLSLAWLFCVSVEERFIRMSRSVKASPVHSGQRGPAAVSSAPAIPLTAVSDSSQ